MYSAAGIACVLPYVAKILKEENSRNYLSGCDHITEVKINRVSKHEIHLYTTYVTIITHKTLTRVV